MAQNDVKNSKNSNKPEGWHSRRHPTNAEHVAATGLYMYRHGKDHVFNGPTKSDMTAVQVKDQLKKLDDRLGEGVGAAKERAALKRQLEKLA